MPLVGILKMRRKLSTAPINSLRGSPCAALHYLNGKSVSPSCKVTDSGFMQLLLLQTAVVFFVRTCVGGCVSLVIVIRHGRKILCCCCLLFVLKVIIASAVRLSEAQSCLVNFKESICSAVWEERNLFK